MRILWPNLEPLRIFLGWSLLFVSFLGWSILFISFLFHLAMLQQKKQHKYYNFGRVLLRVWMWEKLDLNFNASLYEDCSLDFKDCSPVSENDQWPSIPSVTVNCHSMFNFSFGVKDKLIDVEEYFGYFQVWESNFVGEKSNLLVTLVHLQFFVTPIIMN